MTMTMHKALDSRDFKKKNDGQEEPALKIAWMYQYNTKATLKRAKTD